MSDVQAASPAPEPVLCPHCAKPEFLCICDSVEPLQTRTALLILQHPQEQDRELGTARVAHVALKNSTLKIGLSWPSLSKALGREADPAEWAVLHLGAATADLPRDREVVVLDKKGAPVPDQVTSTRAATSSGRPVRTALGRAAVRRALAARAANCRTACYRTTCGRPPCRGSSHGKRGAGSGQCDMEQQVIRVFNPKTQRLCR